MSEMMNKQPTQETRECLLCLRIPLEKIRSSVEDLLPHVDDAVIDSVAERAAKLIASTYEQDRIALCGKSPTGLMAAAIYLSGIMEEGVTITQGMVARALKSTTTTIRTRAYQINDILGIGIMEHRLRSERRKQYVCPFCEKTFPDLDRLTWHLQRGRWKPSTLRVSMFNDEGIMVDEDKLEKMKRHPGTCERPPAVRPRPRWRESPVVGRYIVTG